MKLGLFHIDTDMFPEAPELTDLLVRFVSRLLHQLIAMEEKKDSLSDFTSLSNSLNALESGALIEGYDKLDPIMKMSHDLNLKLMNKLNQVKTSIIKIKPKEIKRLSHCGHWFDYLSLSSEMARGAV